MADAERNGEREQEPKGLEQHLLQYVRDSTLWPVLIVVVLIAATFGAALLVYALLLRNLFALAAVALLAVMSGHALLGDLRARRFGGISAALLVLWLASAALAAALRGSGIF